MKRLRATLLNILLALPLLAVAVVAVTFVNAFAGTLINDSSAEPVSLPMPQSKKPDGYRFNGSMGDTLPDVPIRVNGYIVSFPDAQPFIDENSRTLVPVRFVTEQLGATVEWDDSTMTASVAKDGCTVEITIGSPTLKVSINGTESTVQMDTAAVLKGGRTFVPIRFVAEALGAYVDYSDLYMMIGIYMDKLAQDQIKALTTIPLNAAGFEAQRDLPTDGNDEAHRQENKSKRAEAVNKHFGSFANAREANYFRAIRSDKEEIFDDGNYQDAPEFVAYKIATLSYGALKMSFLTDSSCIYQASIDAKEDTTVRGYLTMELTRGKTLTKEQNNFIDALNEWGSTTERGYEEASIKGGQTIIVDAHIHGDSLDNFVIDSFTICQNPNK